MSQNSDNTTGYTTPLEGPTEAVGDTTAAYAPPATEATPPTPVLQAVAPTKPRVRWAGIIWGLVFLVVAAFAIIGLSNPTVGEEIGNWATSLSGPMIGAFFFLVVGAIVLIIALIALLRRAQQREKADL